MSRVFYLRFNPFSSTCCHVASLSMFGSLSLWKVTFPVLMGSSDSVIVLDVDWKIQNGEMMTIDEIEELIEQVESQGLSFAPLTISKKKGWSPRGFKVRTPFGLCELANLKETETSTEVTFFVKLRQLKSFMKKYNAPA